MDKFRKGTQIIIQTGSQNLRHLPTPLRYGTMTQETTICMIETNVDLPAEICGIDGMHGTDISTLTKIAGYKLQ